MKEYFGKIKVAESGGAGAGARRGVDREAVGRFVRAGLAGNERLDRERAKRKLEGLSEGVHTRFDGVVEDSAKEGVDTGTDTEPKRKKHKGRKAPKAANRFGAEYADLATRDAAEDAAEEDGEGSDHAGSDDEGVSSTPQKARSKSSTKPKTSKEAMESLLDDASEDKSGRKKRKRKKSPKKVDDARAKEMQ